MANKRWDGIKAAALTRIKDEMEFGRKAMCLFAFARSMKERDFVLFQRMLRRMWEAGGTGLEESQAVSRKGAAWTFGPWCPLHGRGGSWFRDFREGGGAANKFSKKEKKRKGERADGVTEEKESGVPEEAEGGDSEVAGPLGHCTEATPFPSARRSTSLSRSRSLARSSLFFFSFASNSMADGQAPAPARFSADQDIVVSIHDTSLLPLKNPLFPFRIVSPFLSLTLPGAAAVSQRRLATAAAAAAAANAAAAAAAAATRQLHAAALLGGNLLASTNVRVELF